MWQEEAARAVRPAGYLVQDQLLQGGLEEPDVTLLPKHPLHQDVHGPWAKKA